MDRYQMVGTGQLRPVRQYQPILHYNGEYTNKLLIFSSNRPGGKGGFDLYRAGVSL